MLFRCCARTIRFYLFLTETKRGISVPIFNRLQIENLEKYIFNSYIHDAKILSFKYDIAEKIINIETLNENFAYKINFIFYNVKFFLSTSGHAYGSSETILSLTLEKNSAFLKDLMQICKHNVNDCIYLLFQLFSGDELHIVFETVSIDQSRRP